MAVALQLTQNFTRLECGECGINFWVPDHFDDQRREDKRGWYCPNGHCRAYKESESDRLRKQLADKQRELERANQARDSARARAEMAENSRRVTAGHLTRLKKRVGNGVCPCCSRSFSNLQRHIASKHPEFKEPV